MTVAAMLLSAATSPQATGGSTPEEAAAAIAVILSVMLTIALVTMAVALAINIAICALLHACLARVPPQHRKMEPGLVWLLLIPLFNLVWNFFVFLRLPESYQSYFAAQGRTDVGDCGRGIGQWYAICAVLTVVPCVSSLASAAAIVLLIIFLVKAFDLRGQIPIEATAPPPAAPPPA